MVFSKEGTKKSFRPVVVFWAVRNKVWMPKLLINPHLIGQKDEVSWLQGSHPKGVTHVYSIGRGCRSDIVKHICTNYWYGAIGVQLKKKWGAVSKSPLRLAVERLMILVSAWSQHFENKLLALGQWSKVIPAARHVNTSRWRITKLYGLSSTNIHLVRDSIVYSSWYFLSLAG